MCRKVLAGMDTVYKFAELPTKKEGIFVMPLERITILSTFVVYIDDPLDTLGTSMVLNKNEITTLGGLKQDPASAQPPCACCALLHCTLEHSFLRTRIISWCIRHSGNLSVYVDQGCKAALHSRWSSSTSPGQGQCTHKI